MWRAWEGASAHGTVTEKKMYIEMNLRACVLHQNKYFLKMQIAFASAARIPVFYGRNMLPRA